MEQMATIGLDIAKSVFQVHGIGKSGSVVVQRRLRRSQVLAFFSKQSPCVVGIEACASSHFWAREIGALGHDVRLMPAAYVKPYLVKLLILTGRRVGEISNLTHDMIAENAIKEKRYRIARQLFHDHQQIPPADCALSAIEHRFTHFSSRPI